MFGAVFITSNIPGNAIKSYNDSQAKSCNVIINDTFNSEEVIEMNINDILDLNDTLETYDMDYLFDNINKSSIDSILLEYNNLTTKCFDIEKQNYCQFVRTAAWYSIIF